MKKAKLIALFLALSCLLTACSARPAEPSQTSGKSGAEPTASVPGVDPASGEWIGKGGSYRFVPQEGDGNANDMLLRDGALYTLGSLVADGSVRYQFLRGTEEVFTLTDNSTNLELIGQSAEGFWFHVQRFENGWQNRSESLELYASTGERLKALDVSACVPEGERGFLFAAGLYRGLPWVTTSEDELLLLDAEGQITQRIALPQSFMRPLLGGDGELYLDDDDGQTQVLSRLEGDRFSEAFRCPSGPIFPGDGTSPFFLSRSDGLYRVSAQGETAPIVIYEECSLALSGIRSLLSYGDGRYYCATPYSQGLLEPADPGELHPRIRLSFGYIGGNEYFKPNQPEIEAFNLYSPDYYVDYVDLTENGAYTEAQALDRLNTALTNGTAPDMFSLISLESGYLSPFPYSRKGLFVDLAARIEQDPEISLDDILIAKALQNDAGGLFFLCDQIDITSYIADYERFGDRYGWTFDEYLALDAQLAPGQMVFYNLTRDRFLQESAASYMRTAIDWTKGTCDFNNPGFISLLNTAKKLRETPEPEDPDEMIFWSPNHIFDGTMVAEIDMITNVGDIAAQQRERNVDKLSYIGWPSPDGSCGSVFDLQSSFAIFSTSTQQDGCWAFMKYCLRRVPDYGLPVYRPALEKQLAAAQTELSVLPRGNYEFKEPLTAAEAEQFRVFLSQIEHTNFYDQTAMQIIQNECAAFFSGDKSAEETAALIQSRLSLYVSEQA